jgi:hypothetical protein
MWFDHVLGVLEILLLVWIVVQGEYIRFYEREVFRIQSEREKERAVWREQKRKQSAKKAESTLIATSVPPEKP